MQWFGEKTLVRHVPGQDQGNTPGHYCPSRLSHGGHRLNVVRLSTAKPSWEKQRGAKIIKGATPAIFFFSFIQGWRSVFCIVVKNDASSSCLRH